MTQDHK